MAPALQRKYATVAAEAERLGVNPRTIRRRIADGTIRGYRLGGSRGVRVVPAEVDAAMEPIPTVERSA